LNQLAAWIERAAPVSPQATALIAGGEQFSFAALAERSQGFAECFAGGGFAAVAVTDNIAFSAYAAAYRGVPFLPLNPALTPQRVSSLLEQAGAQLVDASPQNRRDARSLVPIPDSLAAWAQGPSGRRVCVSASSMDEGKSSPVELIIATSGSAGEPKGVMLSGENLAASVAASCERLPLQEGDVWLNCLPLYHIGGMAILYRCAAARATVLLHEGFDARRVWENLGAYGVTHISLVPAMLARLIDITQGAPPPNTLKYALIGGGALSGELAARARAAGWPLCASYGMSETASQLATLHPLPEGWTPGSVGEPLPGFELRLAEQSPDRTGVIQVRGAAVMAGYANPSHSFGDGLAGGWLTTGDWGRIDAAGGLHVLGRRDDMLVSGGVNVHPLAVEAVLLRFPGLRDAAVTALPDEVWGDRIMALVVGDVDLEQLEAWCREHLASAMRPRTLRRVVELPRNALGKLERVKLKEMARELVNDGA
jgi:O-succinylbenzoic acid--CoA ligase